MAEMKVELIDHMGSDLSVVNAARASFGKESAWVETCSCGLTRDPTAKYNQWPGCGTDQRSCHRGGIHKLSEADAKLIGYLARENHWSPFAHAFLSYKIKAPIFVARQLVKHQVGLAWNEESRRYIKIEPEFYNPGEWRKAAENVKQGSSAEIVPYIKDRYDIKATPSAYLADVVDHCFKVYEAMLGAGIAPEMARMVLPLNTMTTWVWSGSLYAFSRVCNLRLDSHAQAETRFVAEQILTLSKPLFPVSMEALIKV